MFLLISLFLAAFVLGGGDVGNDGVEVYLKVGVAAKAFGNGEDAQPLILSRCGGAEGYYGQVGCSASAFIISMFTWQRRWLTALRCV